MLNFIGRSSDAYCNSYKKMPTRPVAFPCALDIENSTPKICIYLQCLSLSRNIGAVNGRQSQLREAKTITMTSTAIITRPLAATL